MSTNRASGTVRQQARTSQPQVFTRLVVGWITSRTHSDNFQTHTGTHSFAATRMCGFSRTAHTTTRCASYSVHTSSHCWASPTTGFEPDTTTTCWPPRHTPVTSKRCKLLCQHTVVTSTCCQLLCQQDHVRDARPIMLHCQCSSDGGLRIWLLKQDHAESCNGHTQAQCRLQARVRECREPLLSAMQTRLRLHADHLPGPDGGVGGGAGDGGLVGGDGHRHDLLCDGKFEAKYCFQAGLWGEGAYPGIVFKRDSGWTGRDMACSEMQPSVGARPKCRKMRKQVEKKTRGSVQKRSWLNPFVEVAPFL